MNDNVLKVNEIFYSIEGEGKRAGELSAFIRLTGCNLRCSYCDTAYAFSEGTTMSPEAIAQAVKGWRNVTLTGGEPLQQDVYKLLLMLHEHSVNIETNGSVDITPYRNLRNVFFTVDYKCPSSQMEHKMKKSNLGSLWNEDVLKFVVGNLEDLERALSVCQIYKPLCLVYVSPVFGEIEPADIAEFMKEHYDVCKDWRLQLQLHKYIWDPKKRGV